ncbi:MAG: ABC transporter permease [Anaerolineaceae bacterium]|nr:ABC transporter permease [Anaerolineaceae bacterium]
MNTLFYVGLLSLALIKATPLVYGALCGLLCERSGVTNIGIEGMMLFGAFMAFLGSALLVQWTGGVLAGPVYLIFGLLCAMIFTALVAALHAVLSIHYKINQVISGTVINLLAAGITNYVANAYIDPTHLESAGVFPQINIPLLSKIPILGPILFSQQPLVYLMLVLVVLVQYLVFHTPWGLRMRAVGEHPRAADTVGINVLRTRYTNIIIGGALAGIGGASLVLESVGRFQKDITTGRGFIALAVLIFGKWTAVGSLGAALLFGFAEALGVRLQFHDINQLYALFTLVGIGVALLGVFWTMRKVIKRSANKQPWWQIALAFLVGVAVVGLSQIIQFPDFSIPIELLGLLPYLLTILVLSGLVRRAIAPAALGSVYEKH